MNQKNTLLGLMSQTSIHAGTGQNTGVIDLPIQREGHNGWPCVFGSAVKGALRVMAEQQNNDNITPIFGSAMNDNNPHSGALLVSDARIILFPVRSLTSQFKWVTCPAVLNRLKKDMVRFEQGEVEIDVLGDIDDDQAISPQESSDIFLEEYRFKPKQESLKKTIALLAKFVKDENFSQNLEKQLLIVNNDNFTFLVQHATPVNAHIAIDSETKTTIGGALWYEETLPAETLLYIGLSATNSRDDSNMTAENILTGITEAFNDKPWLQMGGNETVGMGWCAVNDVSKEV
ncbi:CRISPR-associated RAMP Cmr4 [hydrothermal vent metagenome]|uniref:CRISPR-associated RAMP Cmr4 n=1 Tax=hydrothermal vent metagenome TaxID=652676 RepID=A0A1W1E4K6_9ZZZZ